MSTLGNINSCLNPKLIYNKYTDTKMYVPCRKCFRCRDSYSSMWSRRIENECKQHRYSLFVTLTYDNDHLPLLEPLIMDDGNTMFGFLIGYQNRVNFYRLLFVDLYLLKKWMEKFVLLILVKKMYRIGLNVFVLPLIINLIKLKQMNSELDTLFALSMDLARSVRIIMPYYGMTRKCCNETLVGLYLKLGRTAIRTSHSSTTPHLSTLRNMLTAILVYHRFYELNLHLRFIWQVNTLISGIVKLMKKRYMKMSLMELMDTINSTKILERLNLFQLPVILRIGSCQSVEGYRTLSHSERIRVYATAYDYEQRGIDYKGLLPFEFKAGCYPTTDIHATLVCLDWCKRYHMTPEIFVSLLEDYYYRKDMYLLRTQYEYQEAYINQLDMPLHHLVDFDLLLFTYLPRDLNSFLRSPWKDTMLTYGLNSFMLYGSDGFIRDEIISLVYGQHHSQFYQDNISRYTKIHNDSLKNKELNELLNSQIFT